MTPEARINRVCGWLILTAWGLLIVAWVAYGHAAHNDCPFVVIEAWEIMITSSLAMVTVYAFVLLILVGKMAAAILDERLADRPGRPLTHANFEPPARGRVR